MGTRLSAQTVSTRAQLAHELTALRVHSGLTVRELARRLDVPPATLGGYFSGRHLPGSAQRELFCSLLRACGLGEADIGPWLDALARVRLSGDGRHARPPAPYRGLEPFGVEDGALFFGREAATAEVVEQLRALRGRDGGRPGPGVVIVVGSSGSGKSSLLRAGVVVAVRAGALADRSSAGEPAAAAPDRLAAAPAQAEVAIPGAAALAALARLESADEGFVVLAVDQLEELFRLDASERKAFLDGLASLDPTRCAVVAALRADFYDAAAAEPLLLEALRHHQVLLGPMSEPELREAIVRPAEVAGVAVEDGLVELVLADLAPRDGYGYGHDAGALPLMSHALLATWQRAEHNQLTVAAYLSSGRLRGAVRQSAEDCYLALSAGERECARRLFCRLVNIDEEAPLTRRRVAPEELAHLGSDADAVLSRYVAARLLAADEVGVQVSHEALLTAWPRLAEWLGADRAGLRLHHQLADAAKLWVAGERDPSLLLRGSRLELAAGWAAHPDHAGELSASEQELLRASAAQAAAEARSQRRHTRRLQQLVAVAVTLALAAALLASYALDARASANRARDEALSRQVAIEASQLEPSDPALAMQLALAAYRISPTVQARSTLIDASAGEMPTRILGPAGPTALALGGHGARLAVAYSSSDTVVLYSLAGRLPLRRARVQVAPPSAATFAVALSPDGTLLAAGGTGGAVALYEVSDVRRPVRIATLKGFASTVYDIAFAPDGRSLAAASNDGTVREWRLAGAGKPRLAGVVSSPHHLSLQSVTYSPNGRLLAAAGAGGTLLVWRPGQRARQVAGAGSAQLTSVAFSPGSRMLATGGEDDVVRVFSTTGSGGWRPARAPLAGFTSWVDTVAFAPDGATLVAGGSDNSLRVWSTSSWTELADLEHPSPVTTAAFLPSGRTLLTADAAGTVREWSMPPPSTYTAPGGVFTIDYTADAHMLAAVSGGPRGDVSLFDVADPSRPAHLAEVTMPASFGPVAGVEALTPDGRLLAVGNAAAKIQLVSLADPRRPRLVGAPLSGPTPVLEQLSFDPTGRILASGDNAGQLRLWDVRRPAHPVALSVIHASGYLLGVAFGDGGRLLAAASTNSKVWLFDVSKPRRPRRLAVLGGFASYAYAVAFTPDGRTLAAGSADDTVRLWDVSHPAHPRPLGGPLTGPTSYVYSLSVSPDGRTLAASAIDHAVWLWDIADPAHPQLLADLGAATGQVYDVTFSPDGHTLVASGSDQTLHFWDYRPADVAAEICSRTVSGITRSEWDQYVQGAPYTPPCP